MVKDEIQGKEEAHKAMSRHPAEENKDEYMRLKEAAKKSFASAMKE